MLFPNRRIWESFGVFFSGKKKPPPHHCPYVDFVHFAGRLAHFAFLEGGGLQLPETQQELLLPVPNVVGTANL